MANPKFEDIFDSAISYIWESPSLVPMPYAPSVRTKQYGRKLASRANQQVVGLKADGAQLVFPIVVRMGANQRREFFEYWQRGTIQFYPDADLSTKHTAYWPGPFEAETLSAGDYRIEFELRRTITQES